MRLPRVRVTVRWWLLAVATAAVLLVAYQSFWAPPTLTARDWYSLGVDAMNRRDLAGARERLCHALALDPTSFEARHALAVVAFEFGNFREEYEHETGAIRSAEGGRPTRDPPYLAWLYKSRAVAAVRLADRETALAEQRRWYARAVADLEKARSLVPTSNARIRFEVEYVAVKAELGSGDAERRAGNAGSAAVHYRQARRALDGVRSTGHDQDLIQDLSHEVESRSAAD